MDGLREVPGGGPGGSVNLSKSYCDILPQLRTCSVFTALSETELEITSEAVMQLGSVSTQIHSYFRSTSTLHSHIRPYPRKNMGSRPLSLN